MKLLKRSKKSELNTNGRRISLKYDEVVDENKNLKRELKKLQDELELLKIVNDKGFLWFFCLALFILLLCQGKIV